MSGEDLLSLLDRKPEPRGPGANLPEFTVTELASGVKKTLEQTYGRVRVRGELCQTKLVASGHLYVDLKDADSTLAAVCWKGTVSRLPFRPAEGMDVVATGRITTFGKQSKYQLVIEELALAGEGALLQMLEARRRQLAAEGLFDAARKQTIPYLPRRIAVVTSPTGAVIRDILHRLADRFPLPVMLWPVPVQGETAAAQIAGAITGLNALSESGAIPRPDVIIVARGGGSLEDLMAFNEEVVVRAAAASRIPLISAVGHETDTTLIDHAADLRAPTPTAAAEMAVPVRRELLAYLDDTERRLSQLLTVQHERGALRLTAATRALGDPRRLLEPRAQRLDDVTERLAQGAGRALDRLRNRLATATAGLLHPRAQAQAAHDRLHALAERLPLIAQRELGRRTHQLDQLAARLMHPRQQASRAAERLHGLDERFARLQATLLERRTARVAQLAATLDGYSLEKLLARGFALVRKPMGRGGETITRADGLQPGDAVEIVFTDGSRAAEIKS